MVKFSGEGREQDPVLEYERIMQGQRPQPEKLANVEAIRENYWAAHRLFTELCKLADPTMADPEEFGDLLQEAQRKGLFSSICLEGSYQPPQELQLGGAIRVRLFPARIEEGSVGKLESLPNVVSAANLWTRSYEHLVSQFIKHGIEVRFNPR